MTAAALAARELSWADIPQLVALEAELFAGDAWNEQAWWAELAARPRRDYVVVTRDDLIVGYTGLDLSGEVADVMTIAVAPAAQGMGLGSELLRLVVDRARERGAGGLCQLRKAFGHLRQCRFVEDMPTVDEAVTRFADKPDAFGDACKPGDER